MMKMIVTTTSKFRISPEHEIKQNLTVEILLFFVIIISQINCYNHGLIIKSQNEAIISGYVFFNVSF